MLRLSSREYRVEKVDMLDRRKIVLKPAFMGDKGLQLQEGDIVVVMTTGRRF